MKSRVATAKLVCDARRADTLARFLTEHHELLLQHLHTAADSSKCPWHMLIHEISQGRAVYAQP